MSQNEIKFFRSDEIFCLAEAGGDLGEGSYGKVRLGFNEILGAIAVKFSEMKGGRRERKLLEKKIQKEILHLQQANHDNIVRVFGWTQWPGAIAIVMEFLPAGNLKGVLLDDDILLAPILRLRFCYEIVNGIAFIHNLFDSKRLLHGDIKPANILLTEDLHCKIGDFGAAHLSGYTGSSTAKQPKTMQLTYVYAAPEHLENISTKITPKYDTYSVGITFHMILSREMPFDERSLNQIEVLTMRIIEGQRPNLQTILDYLQELQDSGDRGGSQVIDFLKDEMVKCWQQDPADRPTMLQLRNKLYEQMSHYDIAVTQSHVAQALNNMELEKPPLLTTEHYTIDNFHPPNFALHDADEARNRAVSNTDAVSVVGSAEFADNPRDTTITNVQQTGTRSLEANSTSSRGVIPPTNKSKSESDNVIDDEHSETSSSFMSFQTQPKVLQVASIPEKFQRCVQQLKNCLFSQDRSDTFINEVINHITQMKNHLLNPKEKIRQMVADDFCKLGVIPLFVNYFMLLTGTKNLYPKNKGESECLENIKLFLLSGTDVSWSFCVECAKSGLLSLLVAHIRNIRKNVSPGGKITEEGEIWNLGILFNCARCPESLSCLKNLNMFDLMKCYTNKTKGLGLVLYVTSAMLSGYVAHEDQIHLIPTDQVVIKYIVKGMENALRKTFNEQRCNDGSVSRSAYSLCSGLAQLARNPQNCVAIMVEYPGITSSLVAFLKSGKENMNLFGLQLVESLCLVAHSKNKLSKVSELVKSVTALAVKVGDNRKIKYEIWRKEFC
ncbi:uncharacterized protein LOC143451429 isoform X2 [Clavelina lepadiformis]|uniref:uncharacterized protein LOC143451429 isoform X2 n=1 Tax=Clavelina lepadiformis TaxID=159417 RepID=UPI0040421C78